MSAENKESSALEAVQVESWHFILSEYLLKYTFFWFVYFVVAIWYICVCFDLFYRKKENDLATPWIACIFSL